MTSSRTSLIAKVMEAGRKNSGATVLLHTAVAAQFGLNATDTKTIDLLLREGPMTAGELSAYTGITSASVTALLDRLEQRGLVERVRDTVDRRRVLVHPRPEQLQAFIGLMGPFFDGLRGLLDGYDDAQIEAITRFLSDAADLAVREAGRLGQAARSGRGDL